MSWMTFNSTATADTILHIIYSSVSVFWAPTTAAIARCPYKWLPFKQSLLNPKYCTSTNFLLLS